MVRLRVNENIKNECLWVSKEVRKAEGKRDIEGAGSNVRLKMYGVDWKVKKGESMGSLAPGYGRRLHSKMEERKRKKSVGERRSKTRQRG